MEQYDSQSFEKTVTVEDKSTNEDNRGSNEWRRSKKRSETEENAHENKAVNGYVNLFPYF